MKPIKEKENYIIVKLISHTPPKVKPFEAAKEDVKKLYVKQEKRKKLLELAKQSVDNFTGTVSDFTTIKEPQKLTKLPLPEAKNFLVKLFEKDTKKGFIPLSGESIILYTILEQKLLTNSYNESVDAIKGIKQTMFNKNLVEYLQNRYPTEIYYKGL
jgi:peptidyl-prolyl cis-trans isomerase D